MGSIIKLIIDIILLVFEILIGIIVFIIESIGGGDGGMNIF